MEASSQSAAVGSSQIHGALPHRIGRWRGEGSGYKDTYHRYEPKDLKTQHNLRFVHPGYRYLSVVRCCTARAVEASPGGQATQW